MLSLYVHMVIFSFEICMHLYITIKTYIWMIYPWKLGWLVNSFREYHKVTFLEGCHYDIYFCLCFVIHSYICLMWLDYPNTLGLTRRGVHGGIACGQGMFILPVYLVSHCHLELGSYPFCLALSINIVFFHIDITDLPFLLFWMWN